MGINEYLIGDKIKEDAAKNAHTFAGTSFLEPLLVKMNDIESDTIELQVDKSRIYFTSKKAPNFITINAHCKMCPVKYTLRVKKMPDENVDFEFEIEKTEQHDDFEFEIEKTEQHDDFFEHMINKKREFLVNNFDLVAYRAKITNTLIAQDN
jgi:hypothetical protein